MAVKYGKLFWLVILLVAVTSTTVALVFASSGRNTSVTTEVAPARSVSPSPTPASTPTSTQSSYVRRGRLWPQMREILNTFGDRVEKPGKERLTLSVTVSKSSDAQPLSALLILEYPDRLRLSLQTRIRTRVITFNGQQSRTVGGELDQDDKDLIETLVYDTAEHFFASQMQGAGTRLLGTRFRLDDGAATNYTGPFYDIYQITEQLRLTPATQFQTKLYYFNSDAKLLESVRYQADRNDRRTNIEIQISGWQKMQDQQVPGRIVRLENGRTVLTLLISSASFSPRIIDGIFDNP